ncbi:hypothetical protein Dimus_034239 [Dionaea muscipula]
MDLESNNQDLDSQDPRITVDLNSSKPPLLGPAVEEPYNCGGGGRSSSSSDGWTDLFDGEERLAQERSFAALDQVFWTEDFRSRVTEMEAVCCRLEGEIRERMEGSLRSRLDGMNSRWIKKKSISGVSCPDAGEDNALLDIAVSSGQVDLVSHILSRKKSLIMSKNKEGDLAIHVAARTGQLHSLVSLSLWPQIQPGQEDPFKTQQDPSTILMAEGDSQGNTALHIAMCNHQEAMAWYLIFKYPPAAYRTNLQGISPLYIALRAKYLDLAKYMLNSAPLYGDVAVGLLQGESVVHAAIMVRNKEMLYAVLVRNSFLVDCFDIHGRTPLSFAACIGCRKVVQFFFDNFPDYTFKRDKDGNFPIHKACIGGHIKIVKLFLSQFPNTGNLLNEQGQNILHVAAKCGRTNLVKYLLSLKDLEILINFKDVDGNTPLHLATISKHPNVVYILAQQCRCQLQAVNKDGRTVLDVALDYDGPIPTFEERLTKLVVTYAGAPRAPHPYKMNKKSMLANFEGYKDRVNTLLLVATLVVTVTFAAGITVPGGYKGSDPYEGMATLVKRSSFHVFMISNTVAMFTAVLVAVTLIWAQLGDLKLVLFSLNFAVPMLGISLSMMSIAFMVGTNLVVSNLHWLGVVMLVMGSVFLIMILLFFIPLHSPNMGSMGGWISRYASYIPLCLMLFLDEQLADENPYGAGIF